MYVFCGHLIVFILAALFGAYRVNVDGDAQPTDSAASSPINDMGEQGVNNKIS